MHSETRTAYITDDGQEFSDPQEALDHENALKIESLIDDCGSSPGAIAARLVERRSDVMTILLCGTYEE